MTDKHDKHDKLVEMARECGGQQLHGVSKCIALSPSELAAFRARIVASLCADAEPVAWMMQWPNHGPSFTIDKSDYVYWVDGKATYPDGLVPLAPASTVASLTAQRDAALARVAELEKDAARYQWLRSVPNAFKAQRIVNDTPHGMDATIDAAMNGGNQ